MKTLQCKNCQNHYSIRTRRPSTYIRQFCCADCQQAYRKKNSIATEQTCQTCGMVFRRTPNQIRQSKSGLQFCSQSCAATYNNTHKTYGNRRSKLEAHLESRLRSEFPDLELICNGKEAIGSELDFYFPQLRLAIELNGIFHYEPIYGVDKLERMQANDQQKGIACNAASIELCVIPCTEKHITSNVKERYWSTIRNLVIPLLGRAGSTAVQVS